MRRYSVNQLVNKFFYLGMHRDGIKAMFWGVILRKFAATSVGLFVPIYVYMIGFENFGESMIGGIRMLVMFLVVARLSVICTSLFVEHIIDRIGFRWTFLISSVFLFLKYVLLTYAERSLYLLWIAAIVSGIVTTTYWISRHALFGEDQDETHIGTSLGFIIVLARLAAIIGPVVGGLVAFYFGFSRLFALGVLLAVLSAVPYFFMHHHRRHHPDGISGLLDKIRDRKNFPLMIAWFGGSWDDELAINFKSLYIFLVVGSIGHLGIIWSLVAVVSMIVAYISGRMFDKSRNKKGVFLKGAGLAAIFWPIIALARDFWSVFVLNSAQAIVGSFYTIPFMSQTYRFSFRRDTVAFFAFREIVCSVGTMVFLVMVYLLTFSWSWGLLFFLGSIGILISMRLVKYFGFR